MTLLYHCFSFWYSHFKKLSTMGQTFYTIKEEERVILEAGSPF